MRLRETVDSIWTSRRWLCSRMHARRCDRRFQSRKTYGFRPDHEGMQEDADLARFGGGAAIPLALLAQRTRAATTDAGRIDHAQAAIGALFAAHAPPMIGLLDNAESHPVGGQRLAPRSDPRVLRRAITAFPYP